jgi:hypothetical protein
MATVTINATGTGGTQSGTVTTAGGTGGGIILIANDSDSAIVFDVATAGTTVQSKVQLAAKEFKKITGLNNGAQTLVNLKTTHGTVAQNGEVVYNYLIT